MAFLSRMGIASSLGRSAPAVCAAIRAGVVRCVPIEGMAAWDEEQPSEGLAVGHPASGSLTAGFQVPARWLRLLLSALADVERESAEMLREPRSALWLCLPSPEEARFENGLHDAQWFSARFAALYKVPLPPMTTFLRGAAGFWAAVNEGCRLVDRGDLTRAIVLVADSLLDEQSLRWLASVGRLKTPDRPIGVAPGEAGVCLTFERSGDVAISGVTSAGDPDEDRRKASLNALTVAVAAAVRSTPRPLGATVGNHNGEEERAFIWGAARAVLLANGFSFQKQEHFPAVSIGDAGMAAPAVGIAVAAASYRRRYARPGATLVWSVDEGAAGACLVDGQVGE